MTTVKFKNIEINREARIIYEFIFNCEGWSKYVFKKHPKLREALNFHTKKSRLNFIKKYASLYWLKNRKIIEKNRNSYEKDWGKIENKFFAELEDIIGVKFPKNKKILAYISINPICPRFLNEWTFNIYHGFKLKKAREVIMHECCHFLYFKKWKEMFPKAKKNTFERSHIVWHLSEIAAPIILNDLRIQQYLKSKAEFYEEYEKIKIGGKSVPKFFADIYKKSDNFEDFIKTSYKTIKKENRAFFQ